MSTSRSTDMGDYILVETGEPTVTNPTVWFSRDVQWKAGTEQGNRDQLRTKAQQALAANATFLALATPTAAQVAAQVKLLTRETNAIIRLLVVQSLADISDT